MLKKILTPRSQDLLASLGLLALRCVVGAAFCIHGFPKIQNPFSWMSHAAIPSIFVALAAASEFFGGICWFLGLFTPVFSFLIGCTMTVALATHLGRGDPFVGKGGAYELAAAYLAIALVILTSGPGRFSLDSVLFGKGK